MCTPHSNTKMLTCSHVYTHLYTPTCITHAATPPRGLRHSHPLIAGATPGHFAETLAGALGAPKGPSVTRGT